MPVLEKDDVRDWGRPKLEQEMKERLSEVQSIREKNGGKLEGVSGDDAIKVRDANGDLNILGERLDEVKELGKADEQAKKLAEQLETPASKMRHGSGGEGRPKVDPRSAGKIFAKSKAIEAFREEKQKGIEAEVPVGSLLPELRALDVKGFKAPSTKATLGTDSTLADVDGEFPPESTRVGVLVEELFQAPSAVELFPQAAIDQNAVPFMRETVNVEGAAETAEGALAPEADITFAEDTAPVRKVPVMIPVTEEVLEDESLVRGHVNGRLPLFVRNREDNQVINGDGTGQNLEGVLNLSGIDASTSYSIAADTATDKLESIFSASIRVAENFLSAEAALLGLALWEEIRLAKDGQGAYLIAPATDMAAPRVWGLRVVTNQRMPAEVALATPILVGAFSQASQIWRRRAVSLQVSDSHDDNFGRGILVIKATTRLALTHYRAGGYAVVTSNA